MNKYIAYCRKSTDEKDKQVLSIEAQITELKEFAKRENLTITEFMKLSYPKGVKYLYYLAKRGLPSSLVSIKALNLGSSF